MLLAPQHLQQWDRHLHHLLDERVRVLSPHPFGLTYLELDQDALRNGRFSVVGVRGVLPDGTPFAAPEDDQLPVPRAIDEHFGSRQDALMVSLGLPAARPGRAQIGAAVQPGAAGPRYTPSSVELADDQDPTSERAIELGRRNLTVVFPDDAVGDYDLLPLAQVTRRAEGGFATLDTYVPPCLSIGASELLMRLLRAELEMLITKSTDLSDRRRQRGGVADFSSSDSANFWLLHTVNGYIPLFTHLVSQRRAHPEEAYRTLAALAGALCTFSAEVHPRDVPAYDHRALGETFAGLHGLFGRLLETVVPTKAARIDLESRDGSLYVGRIADPRLLEAGAGLFLGARAELEEQRLIRELPAKLKIASLDRIDVLIANALPGVPLNFTRVPPAALPVRASYVYFQLDSNCTDWEGIRGSKNVAIFAPKDVPGLNLELMGLRE